MISYSHWGMFDVQHELAKMQAAKDLSRYSIAKYGVDYRAQINAVSADIKQFQAAAQKFY